MPITVKRKQYVQDLRRIESYIHALEGPTLNIDELDELFRQRWLQRIEDLPIDPKQKNRVQMNVLKSE